MKVKLGQNFLIDSRVAKREVEYADVNSNDVVLEIGPGNGILTKLLAEKARNVIAIELDQKLYKNLKGDMPDNVEMMQGDALNIDFGILPKFNKIVSNLPFQISSPITFKLLKYPFEIAVLIYQKEFADRMVAEPYTKDYSRLSVGISYRTSCEILEVIPKVCFEPQPKIKSCMVKLIPKEIPPFDIENEKFFFKLTENLFNHRRKKIKTTIKKIYPKITLEELPFLDERVETLTPKEIGILSNKILGQKIK
ncbi:MAG: 16S rRNA (adenine(1518)-N(6)/adenine(1519)-N(6))-dimethyltransferase RsmA [Candidatus Thermoplasmatota archaeon]|nr:16S rRNA (adenine(1518)-N(6)/adenine(1519)-N(6))-dimethyltransferase RsmA [Candidatus Thermoplasmatota archaeon]